VCASPSREESGGEESGGVCWKCVGVLVQRVQANGCGEVCVWVCMLSGCGKCIEECHQACMFVASAKVVRGNVWRMCAEV
jgi:hypothetical protein